MTCVVHNPTGRQPEWKENYYQVVSIDPAEKKNNGLRIERRHANGVIEHVLAVLIDFSKLVDAGQPYITWLKTHLDQYLSYFMEAHIILIEHQQVGKNSKPILVEQVLLTYFCLRLEASPRRPLIYEVSSKLKSQQLGFKGPRAAIKKQTRFFMLALLHVRKDEKTLTALKQAARKQDLLDAMAMIEAFFLIQKLPTALSKDQIQWLHSQIPA